LGHHVQTAPGVSLGIIVLHRILVGSGLYAQMHPQQSARYDRVV
jgi:hypothetical protein